MARFKQKFWVCPVMVVATLLAGVPRLECQCRDDGRQAGSQVSCCCPSNPVPVQEAASPQLILAPSMEPEACCCCPKAASPAPAKQAPGSNVCAHCTKGLVQAAPAVMTQEKQANDLARWVAVVDLVLPGHAATASSPKGWHTGPPLPLSSPDDLITRLQRLVI